jgi:hypothetical protein
MWGGGVIKLVITKVKSLFKAPSKRTFVPSEVLTVCPILYNHYVFVTSNGSTQNFFLKIMESIS